MEAATIQVAAPREGQKQDAAARAESEETGCASR
jgi:hypothetical protein